MTKGEFIGLISDRSGYTKKAVAEMLEALEETMEQDVFAKEDSVRLKIGVFEGVTVPEKPPRNRRNPQTGEVELMPGSPEKHGQPQYRPSTSAKGLNTDTV